MKRGIILGILALATLVVLTVSFKVGKSLQMSAQQSAAVPFTAFMVEKHYPPGQQEPAFTRDYISAVRGDGSTVRVFRYPSPDNSGKLLQPRTLLDVPGRKWVSIDVGTESLLIYPMPDEGAAILRMHQKSFCADTSNLQRSTFLDYEVVRVHEQDPYGANPRAMWMAPKLDCFPLRETFTVGPLSAPTGRTEIEAVFVIEGEPSPSLFEVPATYTERTVPEFFEEFARRYPGQQIGPERTKQILDEAHRAAQANR